MGPTRSGQRAAALCALGCLVAAACDRDPTPHPDGGGDAQVEIDGGPLPHFPADFEERYEELRDCRFSHEHDLRFIRVFASESASEPYQRLSPDVPYPVGANLVKAEYDDDLCLILLEYTEMTKLEPGSYAEGGDWLWQRINPQLEVTESGAASRCTSCHAWHCAPPNGYDWTCAEELPQ